MLVWLSMRYIQFQNLSCDIEFNRKKNYVSRTVIKTANCTNICNNNFGTFNYATQIIQSKIYLFQYLKYYFLISLQYIRITFFYPKEYKITYNKSEDFFPFGKPLRTDLVPCRSCHLKCPFLIVEDLPDLVNESGPFHSAQILGYVILQRETTLDIQVIGIKTFMCVDALLVCNHLYHNPEDF